MTLLSCHFKNKYYFDFLLPLSKLYRMSQQNKKIFVSSTSLKTYYDMKKAFGIHSTFTFDILQNCKTS